MIIIMIIIITITIIIIIIITITIIIMIVMIIMIIMIILIPSIVEQEVPRELGIIEALMCQSMYQPVDRHLHVYRYVHRHVACAWTNA